MARQFFSSRFIAITALTLTGCASVPGTYDCSISDPIDVTRFHDNPIFDINTDARLGSNVNGPSVVKVPSWLPNPLGEYYMYFADHRGSYIKLAYANDPRGPWKLYEPGTLTLDQATAFYDHIASPDIHFDEDTKRVRMYFHGPSVEERSQRTGIAFSSDGINFEASEHLQGLFYFRVFKHRGWYYAIAKNDNTGYMAIYRAQTGISDWEFGRNFLPDARHAAVDVEGDTLVIYYSRVGDSPERIVRSTVDLSGSWDKWTPSAGQDVIAPEMNYEGADHPPAPSEYGAAIDVAQLRDPAIFNDRGKKYLYYSGEGEETINGAEIVCKGS